MIVYIKSWCCRYAWQRVSSAYRQWRSSAAEPFPCPVLVGCSIAVRREYFMQLGGFDQGLDDWGGEHVRLNNSWDLGLWHISALVWLMSPVFTRSSCHLKRGYAEGESSFTHVRASATYSSLGWSLMSTGENERRQLPKTTSGRVSHSVA